MQVATIKKVMSAVQKQQLNRNLEQWARWVRQGQTPGMNSSALSAAIEGAVFTGRRPSSPAIHCIEADIEAALVVYILATDKNLQKVNCLRAEFGIHFTRSHEDKQQDKAHRIGVSLRTYRRHLAEVKQYLFEKVIHKNCELEGDK